MHNYTAIKTTPYTQCRNWQDGGGGGNKGSVLVHFLCLQNSDWISLPKEKKATLNVAFHLLHLCVTLLVHFLQNLCVAAAYMPVHKMLKEEKKVAFPCL